MNYKSQKHPASVILFHGLIAILMIVALITGWKLDENPDLIASHKSIGVAVLILAILRIINRFRIGVYVPQSVNIKGSLAYILEKLVHGLLYVVMFVIPISGWLLSNSHGYPVSFFGLFDLPTLIDKDPSITRLLGKLHQLSAAVFFWLLILHIVGGLVHLVREKSNIFKRMLP